MSMKVLAHKTVLITGASGGLGQEVCRCFQEAGAIVAGVARRGPLPFCDIQLSGDLSTPEGAAACVRAVLDESPRLDAIVHLLGGFATEGNTQQTSAGTWDRMMSLNAGSAFHIFGAALPHMVERGRGRLIAIGSRAGVSSSAGLSAYAASKAALHALVQVIAAENTLTGVTANAVMPSTIDTPANRAAMPSANPALWVTPQSIAALLVWLASDASQDVNGALIPIYGKS